MMVEGPAVENARQLADVTVTDLWFRYFSLGGTKSPAELSDFLRGDIVFSAPQYDVLAHALNERFFDLDLDRPVPYAAD